MDEADMGVEGMLCTYERSRVVLCPHPVHYFPMYFFSRYPLETTKMWNLFKLLTPTCWLMVFLSILSIIMMLKFFTFVANSLKKSPTTLMDITLVPIR